MSSSLYIVNNRYSGSREVGKVLQNSGEGLAYLGRPGSQQGSPVG